VNDLCLDNLQPRLELAEVQLLLAQVVHLPKRSRSDGPTLEGALDGIRQRLGSASVDA
jgi:hypothetical protein